MSAQHTPGPWEFSEWNAGINNRPGYGLMAECGSLNVTVHTRRPKGDGFNDVDCTEEAQANARLIAAAPDLLTAAELQNFAEEWRSNECPNTEYHEEDAPELCSHCFPYFDKARLARMTAIAKAKSSQ